MLHCLLNPRKKKIVSMFFLFVSCNRNPEFQKNTYFPFGDYVDGQIVPHRFKDDQLLNRSSSTIHCN